MSQGRGQVISWYICTVVAVLFLVARLVVRVRKFGKLEITDGLLVFATCCLIGDLAIQQHMWNLGMANIGAASRDNFIGIMQMIVPGSVLYVTSLWAIKVALVLFYKKIAVPGTRLQTIYNVTLGGLAATWAIIFFDIIFQCFPHDKRWSEDPNYQCSQKASDINYWLTILFNIFSDVIIISLPISMIARLQMKRKQKLGVCAVFALGAFVVIASIIRSYYSKLNETMLTCTVSMVETAVAIIAACLPPLRTLFLGQLSQTPASYRHYELSSNHRGVPSGRMTTNIVGGAHKANESEDELVAGGMSVFAGSSSRKDMGTITVDTTIEQHKTT